MKHTKRLLAVMLTLLLAFGLAVPAMASVSALSTPVIENEGIWRAIISFIMLAGTALIGALAIVLPIIVFIIGFVAPIALIVWLVNLAVS
ncbi:MAG: hypothetical protein FWE40_00560 [Oscillospiraceae bacterium]|jgi:hypothetical protein|nr:hypothetical protein [Oscillospiraceae bacterium]